MITENLSTLKINKMTQSQYDRELAADNLSASELYLTPMADHVIEQGTSGNWAYRKWASGWCECFGAYSYNASSGGNTVDVFLPFTFNSSTFYVYACPARNGSVVTKYGDYNEGGNIEHTTSSFKFNFTTSGSYGVGFNFEVKGRWK